MQQLKFSGHYILRLMKRFRLKRRRNTRENKKIPAEEDVRAHMSRQQQFISGLDHLYDKDGTSIIYQRVAGGFTAEQVANFDESGICPLSPDYQYAPTDTTRTLQIGEEKVRVTGCISVNANGQLLPCMFIMKHNTTIVKPTTESKKKIIGSAGGLILTTKPATKVKAADSYDGNDLRKMVITNLHKKEGYTKGDGWEEKVWEKTIFVPNPTKDIAKKGPGKDLDFRIKYLVCTREGHRDFGSIITSQCNAWNDSARFIMFIDLILLPYATSKGKLALWLDNCTVHVSKMVELFLQTNRSVYENIYFLYYLPNMTHLLQVLDLVLNGPLKKFMRGRTAIEIYELFRKFIQDLKTRGVDLSKVTSKDFKLPKPTIDKMIKQMLDIFADDLSKPKMQATVQKSFVSTGSFPAADGTYAKYTADTNQNPGNLYRPVESDRTHACPRKRKPNVISSSSSSVVPSNLSSEPEVSDQVDEAQMPSGDDRFYSRTCVKCVLICYKSSYIACC